MRNLIHKIALLFALTIAFCACNQAEMEKRFQNPSSEVKTAVYWYWISGNISKEGVVEDLKAMKRAGINRAFIGDIGQDGLYTERNVKIFSDEWWEILHTALRTASELDIEIGIFNSPGWSQSGGPWVKPNEAMRYLASAEIAVSGPQRLSTQIPNPTENFQPVRTIAYPAPEGYHSPEVKISYSAPKKKTIDIKALPAGVENQLELSLDKPLDSRSLTIKMSHRPMNVTAHLDAYIAGKWQRVSDFKIDRSNAALNVGFTPYAPATVSFPKTTTDRFRLTFDPSSQAGGIESIELSAMPRISSYAEKTLAKMCQTPLPYWDHYMWSDEPKLDSKAHAIDPEKVIDLSDKISADGSITWDVPEGEWIILRTGMTPTKVTNSPATPEATGLEIDKMSSKHVKTHFNAFIGEILRRIPEKDRSTFRVVVQDSYETGGQNFTDEMIERFEEEYGYSMIPFLPTYYGYVVGDSEKSNRFLWDIRRFIADRVAYEYVGGLKQISNAHGLTTWLECYGHWGFPGEFLQYGGQSDEIGGEFWSVGELGDIENRAASSCGHIYGKPIIWAESNTSGGPAYSRTPVDMKQRTDRFFTEGINATLLHLYIEQADTARYPGINAWFGNEFDAHNTWYSHLDLFTTYTKRCNYMLQQGLNMADVAYLIGEDAPKMTGMQSPALPKGYQFDYINAEVLLLNANVAQGNIILPHGTSYKVLVLPPIKTMRPELLEKIQRLVKDGAIVLGPAPTHSPSLKDYPDSDIRVEKMARELWGEAFDKRGMNTYGKGRVYNGYSLEDIFSQMGLTPDCAIKESEPVLFNHRSTMGAEIYFISNQSNQKISFNPTFRVDRTLRPELWDAVDGSIRALPEFEVVDGGITLPLSLDALGSGFIVFRRAGKVSTTEKNFPAPAKSVELTEPWRVEFEGKLSSHEPITLQRLEDFSLSEDKDLKYFSGTMNYTTEFTCEDTTGHICLNLGRVESMAKVYVNDQLAGGAWCAPYSVNISQYVQQGKNSLRIEVVNKWVNRIVGDMQLPAEERKISLTANPYNAQSAIPASGLIGPVVLEQIK